MEIQFCLNLNLWLALLREYLFSYTLKLWLDLSSPVMLDLSLLLDVDISLLENWSFLCLFPRENNIKTWEEKTELKQGKEKK